MYFDKNKCYLLCSFIILALSFFFIYATGTKKFKSDPPYFHICLKIKITTLKIEDNKNKN
jgi:hypothetical protein